MDGPHGVHPRVCGGASQGRTVEIFYRGPSPRVRGSQSCGRAPGGGYRSIPACAGEPNSDSRSPGRPEVHPRVCGGAATVPPNLRLAPGPSPRVRGSRARGAVEDLHRGSIPACAGEPSRRLHFFSLSGVHPRVCGGARRPRPRSISDRGPSPRVRGSQPSRARGPGARRSIPACAGEPGDGSAIRLVRAVHPRVCGGAPAGKLCPSCPKGPSPRVRGSLVWQLDKTGRSGSIPACAGEPVSETPWPPLRGVHPRVCGGAPG